MEIKSSMRLCSGGIMVGGGCSGPPDLKISFTAGCNVMTKLLLLLLLALVVLASANIPDSLVQTSNGSVKGYVDLFSGAQIWRGIPFAAPPVGANRFRSPQPVTPWEQPRLTIAQANICTQLHVISFLEIGAEDCLYLDVYVPPGMPANAKLPVMVWIYGGGFTVGDDWEFTLYDAQNLVKRSDVIIVAPNYRLGAFGFLSNPDLKAEDSKGSTGNYGLQDQNLALQWVQQNIANFGGDPSRVTIFGESAGAFSVCWHLVSPLSTGLFTAAIMESGTCDSTQFFQEPKISFSYSESWMASIGCDRSKFSSSANYLACIRSLSTSTVMSGVGNASAPGYPPLAPVMPWGPTIDGSSSGLMRLPLDSMQANDWNRVPLLLGTNKDEATILLPAIAMIVKGIHWPLQDQDLVPTLSHFFEKSIVDKILTMYPKTSNNTANSRAAEVLRDYFFACPSRRAARAVIANGLPAYLYQFAYPGDWTDMQLLGDYHASELEFVFDNPIVPVHLFSSNDQAMADTFRFYWTNFAAMHDPNGGDPSSYPTWPKYDTVAEQHMQLNLPSAVYDHLFSVQCDMWDSFPRQSATDIRGFNAELMSQPRIRRAVELLRQSQSKGLNRLVEVGKILNAEFM